MSLRHDALPADGARHVADAERGRGDGHRADRLCNNEDERRPGGDTKTEDEQDRRMVSLSPPSEADREQDRRDREARGRQAKEGAVGAECQQSVGRHRARQGDRDLQQEDAGDGADEPQGRQRTPRVQDFQPRSGVATSTSTPSGSRNLKNRGGSAFSAP